MSILDQTDLLPAQLQYLKLHFFLDNYKTLAKQAAEEQWDPLKFLAHLIEGETLLRRERSTERRIRLARFPVIKTLDQFQWSWPK